MKMRWLLIMVCAMGLWGCRSTNSLPATEVPDAYFHRMITSGHAAFQRGDLSRAAELYENAWVRAQVMDRPRLMGASAYNLAVCLIALGDLERGLSLLQAAQIEMARAGDAGADALIAQAEALRRLERRDEAWQITDQLLAMQIMRPVLLQTYSLQALLALDEGDIESAVKAQEMARRVVRRQTPIRLLARLSEIDGRIAELQGEGLVAAEAFDQAALLYRNEGRFADMARALAEAGRLYLDLNQPAQAIDRYFRAARHHAAVGEVLIALQLLDVALAWVDEADDRTIQMRLVRLFEEVQNDVKTQRLSDVKEGKGEME